MPKAAPEDALPHIETLLKRSREIASAERAIEAAIDELRDIALREGEGFEHKIKGKGLVKVGAGRDDKVTGTAPKLVPGVFLDLPEAKRAELIDSKLVEIVKVVSAGAKPSVTVTLA